jgi:hypothetical protein
VTSVTVTRCRLAQGSLAVSLEVGHDFLGSTWAPWALMATLYWQVLHAYRQQELHFAGAVCRHNLTLELNGDHHSMPQFNIVQHSTKMNRILLGPSWSLCLAGPPSPERSRRRHEGGMQYAVVCGNRV